jgi:CrcB protein
LREFLFLALAGALGTLGRYGLSGLAQRIAGNYFPFGTLAVNIIGSILVGFIMQIGLNTDVIPRSLRVVITVGFLGAFTTFSTFAYETTKYLEDGAWLSGLLNISANVVIGIIAILIGMLVGRMTYGGV